MAEIVNLRHARKQRQRAQKAAAAAGNRVSHGRNKVERAHDATAAARREAILDGARLDPTPSETTDRGDRPTE